MMIECPTTADKPPTRDHWRACEWCYRVLSIDSFAHKRVLSKYCRECMEPGAVRARTNQFNRIRKARGRLDPDERERLDSADLETADRRRGLLWIEATIEYTRQCLPIDPIERLALQLQVGKWPRFKRWDSGRAEPSHYDPTVSVVFNGKVFQ